MQVWGTGVRRRREMSRWRSFAPGGDEWQWHRRGPEGRRRHVCHNASEPRLSCLLSACCWCALFQPITISTRHCPHLSPRSTFFHAHSRLSTLPQNAKHSPAFYAAAAPPRPPAATAHAHAALCVWFYALTCLLFSQPCARQQPIPNTSAWRK